MPHVFKDLPYSHHYQVQLLDRSPVQTPVHTSVNTPIGTPHPSPNLIATACRNLMTIPTVSIPPLSFNRPLPTRRVNEEPDFKGEAADKVSHLDRSPVQTAFQTRAASPVPGKGGNEDQTLRSHGSKEAGETVKALRESFESAEIADDHKHEEAEQASREGKTTN